MTNLYVVRGIGKTSDDGALLSMMPCGLTAKGRWNWSHATLEQIGIKGDAGLDAGLTRCDRGLTLGLPYIGKLDVERALRTRRVIVLLVPVHEIAAIEFACVGVQAGQIDRAARQHPLEIAAIWSGSRGRIWSIATADARIGAPGREASTKADSDKDGIACDYFIQGLGKIKFEASRGSA